MSGGVLTTQPGATAISDWLVEKMGPGSAGVWIDPEGEAHPAPELLIEELELLLSAPIERLGTKDTFPNAATQVGLILMVGRDLDCWLESLGSGTAGDWVAGQLDDGCAVYVSSAATAALGDWVFPDGGDHQGRPGLGWLPGSVILPGVSEPASYPGVRRYLSKTDLSYALGLHEGTALAFGPLGQVEVLTGEPPKIVLGRGWMAP